jgi:hypothetical protein
MWHGDAMTPAQLFQIANPLAMAAWIVLAAWPRSHRTPQLVAGVAVPLLFAAAYTVIAAAAFAAAPGGFSSLDDVALLFTSRWMLLAGWLHYLAFDLLVGCWEARDARERGVPHWLVVPCLFLTFMFGPAGWLAYLAVRTGRTRRPATP